MNFLGCDSQVTQSSNIPACSSGWVSYTESQLKTEIEVQDNIYLDFNKDAFFIGFGAVITLFVVGLGAGFIINQLRKARI